MPHDLLIKNGFVVDGTGRAGRRADVAVSNGKIVEIGNITEDAQTTIDASDQVVAPGFIDPHTHYDAQVCWDPLVTPSAWHGVTTVVAGNCGVGIAPCRPRDREVVMRDLVNVEAMDYDVLDRGISWEWETLPQFLDATSRRGCGLNLAFLAPLTPMRRYVMGGDATERAATVEETAEIKALVKTAVSAGFFGFSTTVIPNAMGYQGRPLACRQASREEMAAYANALREVGKGLIQINLTKQVSIVSDDEYDLLDMLLTESRRPVTLSSLSERADMPEAHYEMIEKLAPLVPRGVVPQTSSVPRKRDITLRAPTMFFSFKCFAPVFQRSKEEQAAVYSDGAFRNAFREEMKGPCSFKGAWDRISVNEAGSASFRRLEGRTVASIAAERGVDGVDPFFDVALADDLDTEYILDNFNTNVQRVAELLRNPSILIGLGDAGAHVSQFCGAGYPTFLLGKWVRERQAVPLELAVQS